MKKQVARLFALGAAFVIAVSCGAPEREGPVESTASSSSTPAATPTLRDWGAEVEWGDSIPAGTVYKVKFDNSGRMTAERSGLPIAVGGKLTTVTHELRMPEADITPIHNLLERAIQGVNLDRAQGSMIGDGGYVHLYLWEGTVAIAAHMNKLGSTAEQGADVRSLIADLSRRFPEGFIK